MAITEETAERGKKGNLYEIVKIDNVSDDVRIATMSNIYTRREHYAVQAVYSGVVYYRVGNPERAVSLAAKLALTFLQASHAGPAQHTDYWQDFCEPSSVRSFGANCALALAQALGGSVTE